MNNLNPQDEEVICVRRDSIISKINLGKGNLQICKCYQPQGYKEFQEIFGSDNLPRLKSYARELQTHLFKKEASILEAFSELEQIVGKSIVPHFIRKDEEEFKIFLEYLKDRPTYADKFLKSGDDEEQKKKLTQEMVAILAEVHQYCNQNLDYLKKAVNRGGKNRLKERRLGEEKERLKNYFQVIIYHCSQEFREYYQNKKLDLEKTELKTIKRHIKTFLGEKRIDLNSKVEKFIKCDEEISGKEAKFVHGDFSPQNIFYTGDIDNIRICDFDKARLGPRNIDLINVIYNLYPQPFSKEKEIFSSSLVKDYLERCKLEVNFQDFLAGLVASRLKNNIRFFSVYCQMNKYEIKKIVGNLPEFSNLTQEEFRTSFLNKMFKDQFRNFFDYYRYRGGEGWESVVEPSTSKKELVKNQLNLVETFLKDAGVMRGVVTSQQREKRWQRILV